MSGPRPPGPVLNRPSRSRSKTGRGRQAPPQAHGTSDAESIERTQSVANGGKDFQGDTRAAIASITYCHDGAADIDGSDNYSP